MRVGILTEYPSPSVQSGPALHTRFLFERLTARGHDVTMMGPDTGDEVPVDVPAQLYPARPYPTHPKVKIPLPGKFKDMWNAPDVELIHSQTNTHMVHYVTWMRKMRRVALLNTHTVHLPTHSHFVLSDRLYQRPFVREAMRRWAEKLEFSYARTYNAGDALIVQSRHFVDYWRDRGVTVPIEIVGRPIDPAKFSRPSGTDPYPHGFARGSRLVCVCRHDREKNLEALLHYFDEHIAPNHSKATLTLVGDGHDHINLVHLADTLEARDRIHFPGEVAHGNLVDWYRHADLFVYTSVSETFGNVVNEALWCGIPVVALNDNMGVAHQIEDGANGFIVEPATSETGFRFGARVIELLNNESLRHWMSKQAENRCRQISHPDNVVARFESIYENAKLHCRESIESPLVEQAVWKQKLALRRHLAAWSWYHHLLLKVAGGFNTFGGGRPLTPALPRNSQNTTQVANSNR